MTFNPFGGLQDLVSQVPDLVQPLLVAAVGAIPFVDEAAAGLGVVAGMHPLVAFTANVIGSSIAMVLVVLLGSRGREAVVARRARRASSARTPVSVSVSAGSSAAAGPTSIATVDAADAPTAPAAPAKEESKGKQRLARWLVRFGVPGASLLAPLALPFSFTALFLVGAGVRKGWVILWQLISIVLWTAVVTISATAAVRVLFS